MTKPIFIKMFKDGRKGKHDRLADDWRQDNFTDSPYWCFRFKRILDNYDVKLQCKQTRKKNHAPAPKLLEIEWMDEDMRDTWEVEHCVKPTFTHRKKLVCSVLCPYVARVPKHVRMELEKMGIIE